MPSNLNYTFSLLDFKVGTCGHMDMCMTGFQFTNIIEHQLCTAKSPVILLCFMDQELIKGVLQKAAKPGNKCGTVDDQRNERSALISRDSRILTESVGFEACPENVDK